DVLLVNPVRDGLNLVAKEGAVLNERDGVLALSREAGAWEELQGGALEVNPFDVSGTAAVLATALDMDAGERADRATRLRDAATASTPASWPPPTRRGCSLLPARFAAPRLGRHGEDGRTGRSGHRREPRHRRGDRQAF